MTELISITPQGTPPEVEFVDREFAEAEAKRAITLLNASDESKVEAWFALQAVADQVGPSSNLGVSGISWYASTRGKGLYQFWCRCVDGLVQTTTGAPTTLEDARLPENLEKAQALLDRLTADKGGAIPRTKRSAGTAKALVAAVSSSPEGREWLGRVAPATAANQLTQMVRVADVYGRSGVYAGADFYAHQAFLTFEDRAALVRGYPRGEQAKARAMSLRSSVGIGAGSPAPRAHVPRGLVAQLAIRSGVDTYEARIILRAVMGGRSKTKLIRAVNEAVKMVGKDEAPKLLRAA